MTVCSLRARRRLVISTLKTAVLALALLIGGATQAFAAGLISGRVTGSDAPAGLQGTVIQAFNLTTDADIPTTIGTTDASGNYSGTLPAGSYVVFTQDIHGYINKIWNNIPCSAVCNIDDDVILANAVVVANSAVPGINFVLDPGGRITGKVTLADGTTPIAGVRVNFVDSNAQLIFTSAVSAANGTYISDAGTATGTVYAFTTNALGFQDEAYNNVHCANCDPTTTGTAIAVTLGATTPNINFALDAGGRITGTVRDGAGNPLANVGVNISDSNGNRLTDATMTDGSGNYSTPGFPAGNYFATTKNDLGLVDQLYNGFPCLNGQCNPPVTGNGTAIPLTVGATAPNINFVLPAGGTITGTVTNAAGGAPVPDVFVGIFQTSTTPGPTFGQSIFIGGGGTNDLGVYSILAPTGTYFAEVFSGSGFANQVYNGLPCVDNGCPANNGTPINVSTGATVGNINFALKAAGSISGTVTNLGAPRNNVQVQLFTSSGANAGSAFTNASGVYTMTGLAVGSYYVRTNDGSFVNQVYNGVVCVNCAVQTSGGSLVAVTANTTTPNINFALVAGGRISGTITNAVGGAPLQGIAAQLFSSTGVSMGNFNTNASGAYITSFLPTGTYYVRTAVPATQNFIDQLWKTSGNVTCVPCPVTTGTGIVVTSPGTTPNINFALTVGGSISGTVTDSGAGGAAVSGMPIIVFNSTGVIVKNTTTDGSGNYNAAGLPTGNYFVRTNPNPATQNYVSQTYSGLAFNGNTISGTPVAVTAGATHGAVNFALVTGGTLSGTVTAAGTGAPIANTQIAVYLPTGNFVKTGATDANGAFTVRGLAAGNYYVSTSTPSFQSPFYVDELYDNLACVGCLTISGAGIPNVTLPCVAPCTPVVTTGTPVTITNGATRTGVDFVLASGAGVITGVVKDAATNVPLFNVAVSVYNAAGTVVKTVTSAPNTGIYIVRGLAPGTYYARTIVSPATPFYTDQAYGGAPCAPCTVTTTTPITVTTNTTTPGIDFALSAGGQITGVVTDASTTNPLPSVAVQLFNASGTSVKTTFSASSGGFTLDGLPAGNYYARTLVSGSLSTYVNRLYDNIPCGSCAVTTGTAIAVADGGTRSGVNFALAASLPTVVPSSRADFDADGKSDAAVYRASVGTWFLLNSSTNNSSWRILPWGVSADVPVAGDYDADGKTDVAIYRPSTGVWWILKSSTDFTAWISPQWGLATDAPVPGDYDGDGKTDVAVFRPSTGEWWILKSSTNSSTWISPQWGVSTDVLVPGDYDGDRKTDIAVYRPSTGTWWILNSTTNFSGWNAFQWGLPTDRPVPGDYDGDGKTDVAIYRPSTGVWWILKSGTNFTTWSSIQWGVPTDQPVPGDYDGDGTTDLAIYRPTDGNWWVLKSSTNFTSWTTVQWGIGGDVPAR